MARTVVAVFESVYLAKKAVLELLDLGYTRDRIDLRAEPLHGNTQDQVKLEPVNSEMVMDELQAGGSIGAGIGGSLGMVMGLLVLLGALNLPFLAAISGGSASLFPEIATLTGAGILTGAILGSLLGGLVGLGVSENEIRQYAKTVRRAKVTIMVVADGDAVDGTIAVLEHNNPLEVKQRSIEWNKAGEKEKKLAEQTLHIKVTKPERPR